MQLLEFIGEAKKAVTTTRLSRNVPELQLDSGVPYHELLESEVHPYGGLVVTRKKVVHISAVPNQKHGKKIYQVGSATHVSPGRSRSNKRRVNGVRHHRRN